MYELEKQQLSDLEGLRDTLADAVDGINGFLAKLGSAAESVEAEEAEEALINVVEIGTLEPGLTVKLYGIEVDILDVDVKDAHGKRGVLVLSKDVLFQKAFDEKNLNNWSQSSLREYMDAIWLRKQNSVLEPMEIDRNLTSDDGLDDYGVSRDYVTLISCDEYRKYRKYISEKSGWWWTLTARSIQSSGDEESVIVVVPNGAFANIDAANELVGVVPMLLLRPDAWVEAVDETH